MREIGLVLVLACACLGAWGAEGALAQVPATPGDPDAPASVLIVFDASKSMRDSDGSGRRKIDAARSAVRSALGQLAPGTQIGIRVFGARAAGRSRAVACRDSQLLAPIGDVNTSDALDRLADITPNGRTPIGYTLQKAAEDLPDGADRTVILISDGGDNCAPPNPCSVAKEASNEGVDFRIEAIGFQVNARARSQLRCIARAGGGSFRDADDADELSQGLTQSFLRSLRTYVVEGARVRGGATRDQAAPVQAGKYPVAKQYTDALRPGVDAWYRVQLAPGDILRGSATLVPPLRRQLGGVGVSGAFDVSNSEGQRDETSADSEPNLFNVAGAEPETLGFLTPAVGGDAGGDAVRARIFAQGGDYFVRLRIDDSAKKALGRQLKPDQSIPVELRFERLDAADRRADESAAGPGLPSILVNAVIFAALGVVTGLIFGRRRSRRAAA